ncbi:hypothetical protein GCM10028796_20990 [Ramlibacter monticola]|uniref:Uncharacterized protein n=1 Tax=Ramlibacter monticola TaxID=1926872 RepID=A0A936Z0Y7_9BURK|nr:hypothetical protein [Ramlibacter monticola]MBL0392352.1 hypothetical protein [Ramlibacter monticola]
MATSASVLVAQPEYVIRGRVIDRATKAGVRGVRVDAWDRDTRYHDLLGQATTDDEGRFTIGYDSVYFGDFAPDRSPDVYFRLYLDGTEVLSTFDKPRKNTARGATDVVLELDMPQLRPAGRDYVSVTQALKVADWWQASDFRGAWREGTDKARTIGSLLGGLGGDALKNFDLAPVRTRGTTEREVVNQPVAAAQQALALKQVEVTEVKSVSEAGRRETLKTLADYPLQLKAGDKVQLYQENGVVKYYTRVPAADANAVDGQAVQKLDEDVQSLKTRVQQAETLRAEVESLKGSGSALEQRLSTDAEALRAQTDEVAALKAELSALRKSTAAKEAEIVKLQTDLVQVRQSQDQLIARLPLDRLSRLEQQLGLLAPGAGERPAVRAAGTRKAAEAGVAGKTATKTPRAKKAPTRKKPR